jgi:hypothetical protein
MAIEPASRYGIWVKRASVVVLLVLGGTAHAGVMGGFGGREDAYLVGADRVCTPLAVEGGVAKGVPSCHKAASDEIAQLSIKTPKAERGTKARFAATASAGTLTVTKPESGEVVVTWTSIDPISKVVDVYGSTYGNVVAVELMIRRGGRDQADVVAFDLHAMTPPTAGAEPSATPTSGGASAPTKPGASAATEKTPSSKELDKALAAARKAKGKAAIAAWAKVTALDADNSEARYGTAVALAQAKKSADAVALLQTLAGSKRADAIEFLVAARFDPAFAGVRADADYRKAVGLDRPPATFYEHVMGLGGSWEQAGTSCDVPSVSLTLTRDRAFKLRVKTACEGDSADDRFSGTWDLQEPTLVLSLPTGEGANADQVPCTVEAAGAEDAIHCTVSKELDFTVRPVRR